MDSVRLLKLLDRSVQAFYDRDNASEAWRLVARDPVALDYCGWQIIEPKRPEKGMKSLNEMKREPTYIATAADLNHRLGTNDPKRINLVEV